MVDHPYEFGASFWPQKPVGYKSYGCSNKPVKKACKDKEDAEASSHKPQREGLRSSELFPQLIRSIPVSAIVFPQIHQLLSGLQVTKNSVKLPVPKPDSVKLPG
jgi:hypothetical protein